MSNRQAEKWLKEFLKQYAKWGGGRVVGDNKIDFSDSAGSFISTFYFDGCVLGLVCLNEKTSISRKPTTIILRDGMKPEDAVKAMVQKATGQ